MERNALKPHIITLALLVTTSLALAYSVNVNIGTQAGIKLYLPDQVQQWKGSQVLFCQTPSCRRAFTRDELGEAERCPECGGVLDTMSLAERQLLPADTLGLKKSYRDAQGEVIHASVVLSGKERGSIHRPQVCLVGQGRRIVGQSVMAVPLVGRDDLKIMVLDLVGATRMPDGRPGPDMTSYYAYWFVGKDRETPYHIERIAWMALDRVFRNVAHRWAYIALGGGRQEGSDAHLGELREFVQAFYPQIQFN